MFSTACPYNLVIALYYGNIAYKQSLKPDNIEEDI